jgi:hypothetical protein
MAITRYKLVQNERSYAACQECNWKLDLSDNISAIQSECIAHLALTGHAVLQYRVQPERRTYYKSDKAGKVPVY